MRGGLRFKRVTFSLSIILTYIVEEKVTLFIKSNPDNAPITFFNNSRMIEHRYFATKPQQRHSCKSSECSR